jgi:hypothetical protein
MTNEHPPEELGDILLRLQALAKHYQNKGDVCLVACYLHPKNSEDAYSKIFYTDHQPKHIGDAIVQWIGELNQLQESNPHLVWPEEL